MNTTYDIEVVMRFNKKKGILRYEYEYEYVISTALETMV